MTLFCKPKLDHNIRILMSTRDVIPNFTFQTDSLYCLFLTYQQFQQLILILSVNCYENKDHNTVRLQSTYR